MFCPKCSQEQASEDIRFCSRCGFQLNVVKALLVSDSLPAEGRPQKASRSFSKRDMTFGALLMFIFAFAVAATTVDMPPSHSARILLLIIAWLILTLLLNIKPMIQYFMKGDDTPALGEIPASMPRLSGITNQTALPGSQSIAVDAYMAPAATTADIKPHISVTEDTTDLLEKVR